MFVAIIIVLFGAWYLSFSATRLDRLHHRVETSWEHLDALLQRRAALALEIAHQSDLDPAMNMLLTACAYESRESSMAERNEAESLLSESLKILRGFASTKEIEIEHILLDRLEANTEKIKVGIALHLQAVSEVKSLRAKLIFRIFHLAGRAKLPFKYSFEDDAL